MEIALPDELARFVERRFGQGGYASPDDVVCEALVLLKEQTELGEEDVAELRREIMIGVEQLERGQGSELDMEAIKAEARRRWASKRQ